MEEGTAKKDFALEDNLRKIRSVLEQMQSGDLDFDENVKLFTQGTHLIESCRKYLDSAEMQVTALIEKDGQASEVDFQ